MTTSEPARLIAVGDIHGQAEWLQRLFAVIVPARDDLWIFLGDYIDRGPASAQVIEFLLRQKQEMPQTIFLRGNHEQMFLDAYPWLAKMRWRDQWENEEIESSVLRHYLANGGDKTLASYQQMAGQQQAAQIPADHLRFLEQTRFYYHFGPWFFAHAGVDPDDPYGLEDQGATLLWSRDKAWLDAADWSLCVVHGHTPVREPLLTHQEVNLDTGAGYGRRLTACDLLHHQVWQVGAA